MIEYILLIYINEIYRMSRKNYGNKTPSLFKKFD